MDSAHGTGDGAENSRKPRPAPRPDDQAAADHSAADAEHAADAGTDTAVKGGPGVGIGEPTAADGSPGKGSSEGASASKPSQRPWQRWGKGLRAAVAAIIITVIGGLAASYAVFYAGPSTTTTAAIGNPGHPPGHQDVSTMTPGQRFYAVPNFYDFQSCGRPCWLPLYQMPTEQSEEITQDWPCEYYDPTSTASGPACLQPATGRTPTEMANAAVKDSGDRILVVCQVTDISQGKPAQTLRNQAGQSSSIWDLVAVPASHVFRNNAAAAPLTPVPRLPGFYEAYAPDIWLGNTGWHSIPCK